jgi:hypothetical protein
MYRVVKHRQELVGSQPCHIVPICYSYGAFPYPAEPAPSGYGFPATSSYRTLGSSKDREPLYPGAKNPEPGPVFLMIEADCRRTASPTICVYDV